MRGQGVSAPLLPLASAPPFDPYAALPAEVRALAGLRGMGPRAQTQRLGFADTRVLGCVRGCGRAHLRHDGYPLLLAPPRRALVLYLESDWRDLQASRALSFEDTHAHLGRLFERLRTPLLEPGLLAAAGQLQASPLRDRECPERSRTQLHLPEQTVYLDDLLGAVALERRGDLLVLIDQRW